MRICVGAFLVEQRRVLLGLRSPDRKLCPETWDAFGGHVEPDESLSEALERELREEIQVKPVHWVPFGMLDEPKPDVNGVARYHMFVVTRWQGEPTNCGGEHSEIRWFPIIEATRLPVAHPGYVGLLNTLAEATPRDYTVSRTVSDAGAMGGLLGNGGTSDGESWAVSERELRRRLAGLASSLKQH